MVKDAIVMTGGTTPQPDSLFSSFRVPSLLLCLAVRSHCKQITLSNTQCLLPALQSSVFFMRNDRSLCNPSPLVKKPTRFMGVYQRLTTKHLINQGQQTLTHRLKKKKSEFFLSLSFTVYNLTALPAYITG